MIDLELLVKELLNVMLVKDELLKRIEALEDEVAFIKNEMKEW